MTETEQTASEMWAGIEEQANVQAVLALPLLQSRTDFSAPGRSPVRGSQQ